MTDAQALLLVLAAVYLSECVVWMRRSAVGFRPARGGRHRIVPGSTVTGTVDTGGWLAPPLPPLGPVFVAEPWPVSLSPDGALSWVAPAFNPGPRPEQVGRHVTFASIRSIAVSDREVLVDGSRFLVADSSALARRVAETLGRIRGIDASRRAAAIRDETERTLAMDGVRERLEAFRRAHRRLAVPANLLFAHLLVVAPALILLRGPSASWPWILAPAIGLQAVILAFFVPAHRRLHPHERHGRWSAAITMLLVPPAAVRAIDYLSRDLLAGFHPLAVARALCDAGGFEAFAAGVVRDMRHPIPPVTPPGDAHAAAVVAWQHEETRRAVEAFVERETADRLDPEAPPRPDSDASEAYCPRCHAQFTTAEAACADCGGLAPVAYPRGDAPRRESGRARDPGQAGLVRGVRSDASP